MKKTVLVLLSALMIACLSAGAMASSFTPCSGRNGFEYIYGYVHVFGECYVRDEPSMSGYVVGTAWRSEELDWLGDTAEDAYGREWYRVVINGGTGWICEDDGMLFSDW